MTTFALSMHFLIIHSRYSRTGGEEQVVALQTELLRGAGHSVRLYERDYAQMQGWRFPRLSNLFSAIYNRRSVKDIKKIIRQQKVDVAIVHNLYPLISPAVLPVLQSHGVRVLMTLHNFRLVCPTGLFFRQGAICERCRTSGLGQWNCLFRNCQGSIGGSFAFALRGVLGRKRILSNVDKFLALSEFQRDKLIECGIGAQKFAIVPNFVSVGSAPSTTTSYEKHYVAYVGRLSSEKGVSLLIAIAQRLPHREFRVAGSTAQGVSLEKLPNNIKLLGHLRQEELADLYTNARCTILTSICWEAFPLTVLEAMAYGSPVVVPYLSSLPEIVDLGAAGMLYKAASVEDLATKIELIFSDSALCNRLINNAKSRVETLYSAKQYLNNILQNSH
ncbi:MAG: glycosyltransferase family 4 protein [Mucinivorans sp.]